MLARTLMITIANTESDDADDDGYDDDDNDDGDDIDDDCEGCVSKENFGAASVSGGGY